MSLRTEGGAARGRSLVLSRRPRHQTCLLVRRRRQGKTRADRAGNFAAGNQLRFAAEQRQSAIFDRQRARRMAVAAGARRAGHQHLHGASPLATVAGAISPDKPARQRGRCRRPADPSSVRAGLNWRAPVRRPVPQLPPTMPRPERRPKPPGRASAFQGRPTGRRGRAPACRSGRIVNRKAGRLGPDAADRHPWRTGACGPAGERDFQVQWPATDRPSRRSRRAARRTGIRSGPIVRRYRMRREPPDRCGNSARCRGVVFPAGRARRMIRTNGSRKCSRGRRKQRDLRSAYFSSCRCRPRTNSVKPTRRARLSRSALRIDCTSAKASSTS